MLKKRKQMDVKSGGEIQVMVAENCSGEGGAAVDSEEENEEEGGEKIGGGALFPEIRCGPETPRSLVDLDFLSH